MVNRRIVAVHLWALPVESAFEDRAILGDGIEPRALIAVREEHRGQRVLVAVSDEARLRGIKPGIKESEGKARDFDLEVRPRDVEREQTMLEHAAELLFTFGPEVEIAPPNLLFVEIGKSRRAIARRLKKRTELDDRTIAELVLRVMNKAGHQVSVAIAKDPDTARTFAEHLSRTQFVEANSSRPPFRRRAGRKKPPPKAKTKKRDTPPLANVAPIDTTTALERLPLRAIVWTDPLDDPEGVLLERMRAAVGSLELLGIHDIARFVTLPVAQVSSRFGEAGQVLFSRASGHRDRPLRRFKPPERTVERFELDAVTEALEPILFVLKRLFDRLEARLAARSRSIRKLSMGFLVEPGLGNRIDVEQHRPRSSKRTETIDIEFARATRRASTMLSLARERIGAALPGAVMSVSMEAHALETDHGSQLDLFTTHAQRIEEVGELIGRLQAALGARAVFSPTVVDTHRPEGAWSRQTFDIESALAPPPIEKPAQRRALALTAPLERQTGRTSALPTVNDSLVVTTIPDEIDESEAETRAPWPKAIARQVEDEPLPPLPPRPLELFDTPERATLVRTSGPMEEGVLVWRGRRHPLVRLGSTERLEAEWWTPAPLARDYWIAEVADGRRLWLFAEPSGGVYVHGIFD